MQRLRPIIQCFSALPLLTCCLLTVWAGRAEPAHAGELIQWHSSNIQLLRGWDYELGDAERTIVTFEHANKWRYGDFFMFADVVRPDSGDTRYYTELAPRFSLSKISGTSLSYGIVKDVLISTMIEKPETKRARYLYGGAVDLDVPGFTYLNVNAYVRDNPDFSGNTHQFTVVWKRPFTVSGVKMVTEGFADFAGREGSAAANEMIVPRLLVDIGDLGGGREGRFYAGVEWQYWHNKFGVRGVTESVPQLQVKWVF